MSKRVKYTHHDPEIHSKHLKRQLDSLEKDNHQPLSDVEGLISIALAAQEEETGTTGSKETQVIDKISFLVYPLFNSFVTKIKKPIDQCPFSQSQLDHVIGRSSKGVLSSNNCQN